MQKHLIIASYDGISTHYCGVGTTIQDTIYSLNNLEENAKIKISLAYISADPNGSVFDRDSFIKSSKLIDKTRGNLIPICNGTPGFCDYDMWQSFPQWKNACASLATALNIILEKEEDNVLMLHDTPFIFFQEFKQQIFNKKLRCFYFPRSSGLNHTFGEMKWRKERVKIEKEAFQSIQNDPDSSVMAIGENFGRHLTQGYGLSFRKKDYLLNGLYFGRFKDWLNRKFDISELKKFDIKINPNSKIIFSWGRASIAKGIKELLSAWRKIHRLLPEYYMIVQAPNNSGEDHYFNILKKYEKETPRTIVLDDFNPKIWQTILRTKNTDIVCIPSIMDPNPHTPIEAKLFSLDMNYVIIGSNLDGVKDSFTDKECLWVNPYNNNIFANQILKAASMTREQKCNMRESNAMSISQYDYEKTIIKFLRSIRFI